MKSKTKIKTIANSLFYDIWYLFNPPWDTGISAPELYDFMNASSPGIALDLGCGTGTNLLALLEKGWRADGVDFSWIEVRKSKSKLRNFSQKARIFHSRVTEIDFLKDEYDLILDIGCYHALTQQEKNDITRILPAF